MDTFMAPILEEQERLRRNKEKQWRPRLVFTLGNHEYRIERATEEDPMLDGLVSFNDFNLKQYGWEVYDYLDPVEIDGVAYCHYFTSGVMGRPVSSARLMLQKKFMSCTMGHVQDREIAYARNGMGKRMTGLFAGIFYQHDEGYLNAQTNGSWAGVWIKHEVCDGAYDEMPVSMAYLRQEFGA
jgi:predicted MPP superfamily phosphohydrolase